MTLDEAKSLLSNSNIPFDICEFENEAEYLLHTTMFPNTKNVKSCKIIVIIIKSNNGKKDIELQFNAIDNAFKFEELRFGDFCFEMFDYNEAMLADDLVDRIKKIQSGNFVIIAANNIIKKRWLGDACFDLNDDDDVFGKSGYEKAMRKIKKPKGIISKLLKSKIQYDIYDWNTYQCIIK